MTICTRRVITRDARRTCVPVGYWEAWVENVGTRYDGRTKAEAVGACVLGSPSFGTSATLDVKELPVNDRREARKMFEGGEL